MAWQTSLLLKHSAKFVAQHHLINGMKLSVIIVNYNVKYFLEHCLCSVQKAVKNIDAEVLVIDNRSCDGSVPYLKRLFPWVQFIENTENLGFGKANNMGIKLATGKFVLLLNPDTLLPEDALHQCLITFEKNEKAGAIGVRMIDGSGRFLKESKRAFPTPAAALYKLTGISALFPTSKVFSKYHLGHLSEHQNHEVDVLCGAFIMIKKTVLERTGGFDEDFFMYGEDIDLSYRIQKAGYKNLYLASTSIIHFKGESSVKGSPRYVKMFYRAMEVFVKKHYGGTRKAAFAVLLRTGIWLRASIGFIAGFVKKTRSAAIGKTFKTPTKILIASDEKELQHILQILQAHHPETTLAACASNPAQLEALQQQTGATEVVFSGSSFGYKHAIDFMSRQHDGLCYHFYNATGQTIISSPLKNEPGDVAALNKP